MPDRIEVKRREFLKNVGVASATSVVLSEANAAVAAETTTDVDVTANRPTVTIQFKLNGKSKKVTIDPRTTLVDLLREDLQHFGTKKGCDHGACGACTVHINGRRVLSCLTLAATVDQTEIKTIEGVASGENLHPMQQAFLRCDAYQCGYCTPGQIMSGIACVDEGHAAGSSEETREWMSGNLCRCSAYPNILAAVRQVAGSEPESDPASGVVVISDSSSSDSSTSKEQS